MPRGSKPCPWTTTWISWRSGCAPAGEVSAAQVYRLGGRLSGLPVFDAPARAFYRVLTGDEAGEGGGWGRPQALPPPEQRAAGRLVQDEVVGQLRRVILDDGPMDLTTAILVWLVKYGEGGSPPVPRVICARRRDRFLARRRLRDLQPRISDYAAPELAQTLIEMMSVCARTRS